jgi:hypothetical protein
MAHAESKSRWLARLYKIETSNLLSVLDRLMALAPRHADGKTEQPLKAAPGRRICG